MVNITASSFLVQQAVRNLESAERARRERDAEQRRKQQRTPEEKTVRGSLTAESKKVFQKESALAPKKAVVPGALMRPTLWNEKNALRNPGAEATPFEKGIALIMELESKGCSTARCLKLIAEGADLSATFADDDRKALSYAESGYNGKRNEAVISALLAAKPASNVAPPRAKPPTP